MMDALSASAWFVQLSVVISIVLDHGMAESAAVLRPQLQPARGGSPPWSTPTTPSPSRSTRAGASRAATPLTRSSPTSPRRARATCATSALRAAARGTGNASDKPVLTMARGEEVADVFLQCHALVVSRGRAAAAGRRAVEPCGARRASVLPARVPREPLRPRDTSRMCADRGAPSWFRTVSAGATPTSTRKDLMKAGTKRFGPMSLSTTPKTFDQLAMDPKKKKEIMDDLDMFKNGKRYHRRVGKPWKRGYLLYGPPGTGKSTMVVAMANYLDYDVYDFELTSVKTNTELRKLPIETKSKSIMVFEDIDCSLDLTGKRKSKEEEDREEEEKDGATPRQNKKDDNKSKVTLSGLLNIIDGLWSACGEERLIVFTTNHLEMLDPALIRTGRMDKKIEMSYCDLETFKFLAEMHLEIDNVEEHEQYDVVKELLKEVNMVPADVGEHLTTKTPADDAKSCLQRLVMELVKAKGDTSTTSEPGP